MMQNGKNKTGMKVINRRGKLKQEWKYEQDGKEETEKKEINRMDQIWNRNERNKKDGKDET